MTKDNFSNDIEEFFTELNVRNSKWFPFGTDHSSAQNFRTYFHIWYLLLEEFNVEEEGSWMDTFLSQYDTYILDKACLFINSALNQYQSAFLKYHHTCQRLSLIFMN